MKDERRISLRLEPEFYDRLDDKRHGLKTSFQKIGVGLLEGWLAEHRTVAESGPSAVPQPIYSKGGMAKPGLAVAELLSPEDRTRLATILKSGNEKALKRLADSLDLIAYYAVHEAKTKGKPTKKSAS